MRNGTVIEDEVKKTVGSSHAESYGHCKDFDFYSEDLLREKAQHRAWHVEY